MNDYIFESCCNSIITIQQGLMNSVNHENEWKDQKHKELINKVICIENESRNLMNQAIDCRNTLLEFQRIASEEI